MTPPTSLPSMTVSKSNKYRAVILDYGLVLCKMPSQERIDKITQVFGLDHANFWPLYEKNRGPYDCGELHPNEYWSKFAEDTNRSINDATIDQLRRWDMDMWSDVDREMIAWAANLKASGYKTAILSNMHYEFAQNIRASCTWLNAFDYQIFSSEVRMIKPEPAIFQKSLEQLNVSGSEAIFVDDREINIQAARKEGITAIRFHSPRELRQDLNSLGFAILPGLSSENVYG